MGSHFRQIDTTSLWIRATRLTGMQSTKETRIGRGISHVFQGAVKSHESISQCKGSFGFLISQQPTGLTEKGSHQPDAQELSTITKGGPTGQLRKQPIGEQPQWGTETL